MLTLLAIVSSIIQVSVSVYVFIKGRQNLSYLLFSILGITTFFWGLLSFLSVALTGSVYVTLVVRGIMFFATLQVALFYLFANAFPHETAPGFVKEISTYTLLTLLVAIVSISPFMFVQVNTSGNFVDAQIGPGMMLFVLFVVYSIGSAFYMLIRKFKYSIGLKRNQLVLLLVAATINWAIIPTLNFVLTLLLKTQIFVAITPVFSLLFLAIIAYALVKHRLFDTGTVLWSSTIYVNYYLKNSKQRAAEYYKLQTLVYEANSEHVALDFSGVKELKKSEIKLLKYLRDYMTMQGKKIYFVGYSQKVFDQLRPIDH